MYTKTHHKFVLYISVFILLVSACSNQVNTIPTSAPTEQVTPSPVRELEEVECRTPNPQLIKMTCYDLLVPEDRLSTNSNMIRLHVAIFKSKSSTPATDPILFLSGGPGQPGIPFILYINSYSGFVGSNRDVIVFDQRGTGESQPSLACPEVDQFYEETLTQFFPQAPFNQMLNETWLKCKERLTTLGVNLDAYNSSTSAADVEDLRRALNIEKWNLFGISYGTRLALAVMRDFPNGVRSAVLDSVFPLPETLKDYQYQDINKNGSIQYLINRCKDDVDCNKAYPDLENTLTTLVNKLNESPINITSQYRTGVGWSNGPEVVLTGNRLLETLFFMMYSVNDIPYIPQLIANTQNEDVELVSRYVLTLPPIQANAMSISVICVDNLSLTNKLPELVSPTSLEKLWFDFINNTNQIQELCQSWVSNITITQNETDFASDIPSLLLAGEFDPATPVWLAELTKENLSNSYLYQFSGYGHSLTTSDANTNGCVGKLMVSFWNDPTIQPDDKCMTDVNLRKFITE